MWRVHVKDALTDWYRRAVDWPGVLRILADLPDNVTGTVTIEWVVPDPTV